MNNRLVQHPILDIECPSKEKIVTIEVDGRKIPAHEDEPIAAALIASGIRKMRTTENLKQSRGVFCGIGQCTDCAMIVDGIPNVRTCVTSVRAGMKIETQSGLGKWKERE